MPMEIEAKFRLPDEDTLNALKEQNQLGPFELEAFGPETVLDHYLDTADRRLMAAGYACRLRETDSGLKLTLKSLTPAQANIHRREELETMVPGPRPADWPAGRPRQIVQEATGDRPLQTLFYLRQTRHWYQVLDEEEAVIELSLDEVAFGQDAPATYFGLEAELLEAEDEALLDDFVEALTAGWPVEAESQSKFELALARLKSKGET